MLPRRSTVVIATLMVSLAVFCAVQDRATAAGARQYVTLRRDAQIRHARVTTIEQVMKPAVEHSVRKGALWAGAVMVAGLGLAAGRPR